MAECDKFLCDVRDDTLGAAIKAWGDAFDEGRDLRDFHCYSF